MHTYIFLSVCSNRVYMQFKILILCYDSSILEPLKSCWLIFPHPLYWFRFLSPLSAVPLVSLAGFGLYEFGFPGVSVFPLHLEWIVVKIFLGLLICYSFYQNRMLMLALDIQVAKCVEIGLPQLIILILVSQVMFFEVPQMNFLVNSDYPLVIYNLLHFVSVILCWIVLIMLILLISNACFAVHATCDTLWKKYI